MKNVQKQLAHVWKLLSKGLRQCCRLVMAPKYQRFSLVGGIFLLELLAVFLLSRPAKQVKPEFTRQLFGEWKYTGTIPAAQMRTGFTTTKNSVKVSIARQNSELRFELPLQKPKLTGSLDTITVESSQDQTVTYEAIPNGIKETITLHAQPQSYAFETNLKTSNLLPRKTQSNTIVFVDPEENYQFHIERPWAMDAAGNQTFGVRYVLKKSEKVEGPVDENTNLLYPRLENYSGENLLLAQAPAEELQPADEYQLMVEVDPAWLLSPERQYPIIIDPTVVHDTTGEFATGQLNRARDTGSGSNPSIVTYYQELQADEHTVGLWHMNENLANTCTGGTNDVCDASGLGLDGAFVNQATFTTSSQLGASATTFDGTTDWVSVANNAALQPNQITIEVWVNTTSTAASPALISKSTGCSSAGYLIWLNQNGSAGAGVPGFFVGNTSWLDATGVAINDGNWHHVAATYDGTIASIYVDGVLRNQGVRSGNLSTTSTLYIGGGGGTCGGDLNGKLDEVRISNVVRSADEIKASAQRYPYSVHTSDVLDLNYVQSWTDLTWDERGVQTGDGETASSSASLAAQWNFNETSGTTAAVAAGSCGATCNGALTNFASTGSQDAAPRSGWTADNRRWGAGALMFDGSNDIVNIGANNAVIQNQSSVTAEAWVKPNANVAGIILDISVNGNTGSRYELSLQTGRNVGLNGRAGDGESAQVATTTNSPITIGEWNHVVGIIDYANDTHRVYVNGKLALTQAVAYTATATSNTTSNAAYIGVDAGTAGSWFNGTIDTLRLYTRILPEHEILSNYQAGNIELQTRVGSDSTPDDGTGWEEWRTASNETAINSLDYPSNTNLLAHWPLDEVADNRCLGGTNDVCDQAGSFDGADAGGSSISIGKYFNARSFDGSNDTIGMGNVLDMERTDSRTFSFWFKDSVVTGGETILSKQANGAPFAGYNIQLGSGGFLYFQLVNTYSSNALEVRTTNGVVDNAWHHAAITYDGSSAASGVTIYIDGVSVAQTTQLNSLSANISNASNFHLGSRSGSGQFYKGQLDEVKIFSSVLTATEIAQIYALGAPPISSIEMSRDAVIKQEGVSAEKIQAGISKIDDAVASFWHFDETGGSGAYLKDASTSANHITPSVTTLTDGVVGKARSFASGNHLSHTVNGFTPSAKTIEMWVKPNWNWNDGVNHGLWQNNNNTNANQANWVSLFKWSSNQLVFRVVTPGGGTQDCAPTATNYFIAGKWTHVAAAYDSTGITLYINGVQVCSTGAITVPNANLDTSGRIGYGHQNEFGSGIIDEVKISNIKRTAEEIMESYRMGANHRIEIPVSSTDLSAKKKVPFYIAADRPGTYLEATAGETPHANYMPDGMTRGFWHLEELGGSGAYIKDASSSANHGTLTGTSTVVQGKLGKGRYFNGSTYVNVGNNTSLQVSGPLTLEAWINTSAGLAHSGIIGKMTTAPSYSYVLRLSNTGVAELGVSGNGSTYTNVLGTTALNDGRWHHVVGVYTPSTSLRIYVDGVLQNTNTTSIPASLFNNATNVTIGSTYTAQEYFTGVIDEPRVMSTARTAEEINQAHQVGRRTHPITIDFASSLAHTNPIFDSNDLSFTLTATTSGTTNPGDNIFKGDKIIVRENYNGTEYIAQGTVTAVTVSTGAVTVAAWDSGSTFPASVGFGPNASVFKWQREYWDITGPMDGHVDAITNFTLRLTDGFEGRTIWVDDLKSNGDYLTLPTGSTITSSTTNQYFQYRVINSSSDTAVSPQLRSTTLDYVTNDPPGVATISANFLHDKIKLNDTTPAVRFTASDTNNDSIVYQFQWDTDSDFASATTKTSDADAGFANIPTPGDTSPFNSGEAIEYTWQTALTNNTTYFYRVRGKDPSGTNTYSDWSEIRSFTIDTSITNPYKWFETDADQFTTDATGGVTIDHTNNQVTVTGDTQLNSADNVANWTSSDGTYFPAAQDTTIKQEGTGSVRMTLNSFTGDGSDGTITINSSKNILTDIIAGNRSTYADGIVYRVVTPSDGTTSLTRFSGSDTLSNGLAAGDEILIINMESVSGDVADVGNYEIASVSAISSTTITLASATTKSYNGTTAGNQKVYVQRIPHYYDVTIQSGGTLTATAYNGAASAPYYTGMVAFKAQGTVNVQSGGTINVDAKGYPGGSGQGTGNGFAGYSYAGAGAANWPRNLGGGGGGLVGGTTCAGGGGGGGGYGAVGSDGAPSQTNGGGQGGTTYGAAALTTFFVGSGGGGGGNNTNGPAGAGGIGGGAVLVYADVASVSGTVSANGANGGNASNTAGGGGGGSGGSIMINSYTAHLASSLVTASAGSGGTAGGTCPPGGFSVGGAGAVGRIRVEADTITGTSSPTASTTTSPASSQNDTVTWTTSQDLSNANEITFWVRGTRPGQYMRFEFGESDSSEQTYDITINTANTWEQKTWDISGISASARNAVTKFAFRATDSSPSPEFFYFDDIHIGSDMGTVMSTSITAANIYNVSSKWFSLAFNDDETDGDIKYQIYYDVGGIPTIVPDSVLASNSTGFDTSPVDIRAISTVTYPILYVKANMTYSGGSPILYDWTVNLTQPPEIPSLDSPADGVVGITNTPTFLTTTTDQDGDYMRYKIEVCTDLAMTTSCQTYDQTVSQTGWTGQNAETSTAYTSGTQGSYTVQTPLSWGTTYYWRTYAIDPADTNTWSYTQATPRSFRTNYAPTVPTLDEPEDGATNVPLKPTLKTTSTDQDHDYIRYKIELCTNLAMSANCQTFDQTVSQTGWWAQDTQSNTAYSSGRQGIYKVQNPLSDFVTYYWRSYAIDPGGTNEWTGTQSPAHSFTTVFAQPTECGVDEGTTDTSSIITWLDNSTAETQYRVERSVNGGAFALLVNTAANAVTTTDATIAQGNSYQYRIRAEANAGADYSQWCTTAKLGQQSGSFQFNSLLLEGLKLD